jgi:ubiquinone/menaquinone biosynthesis C-methylase UbiE
MVDTKQAEKAYLRSTGGGAWELYKPFAPPGAFTTAQSAQLIHDFAVLLYSLQPTASDRILDLGAGGCWCADWLGRLNFRPVAVDLALDMLRVGRSRVGHGARALVAGDLEALPFRDGAFDKACCLNALHHVPDIPKALAEICRVLRSDGVVLFSEPGLAHSEKAESVAAMRDCGVLEQDIHVEAFLRACREAGFAYVRLQALAYVVPQCEVRLEEWRAWDRLARRQRPRRALEKMARAALELFGLGKHGTLFEEALTMEVVRLLKASMENHPIVIAAKQRRVASEGPEWQAEICVAAPPPARVSAGRAVRIALHVRNTGRRVWAATRRDGDGWVRVGVQLLDVHRTLIDRDYHRLALPADLPPGGACSISTDLPVPPESGSFVLKCDLVLEGVTWFEVQGTMPALIPIDVG